ncbi:hypothetical protein CAP35_13275 [Chitinophagaceae bacterium IBVUCB1]|nr:hypothetical protein CAP35_13275 [Chitinophagaceae bacterium IBVUCB1]
MPKPINLLRMVLLACFMLSCNNTYRYIYQSIQVDVYDNAMQRVIEANTIPHSGHEVLVNMKPVTVASRLQWGNTAYALTKSSYAYPADALKDIQVITLSDYSTNYKAGSNIASVCSFSLGSFDTAAVVPMDKMIWQINNTREKYFRGGVEERMGFHINAQPQYNSPQRFAVVLITENNVAIADTTVSFTFTP